MREHLSFIDRMNLLFAFKFHRHSIGYNQVCSKATFKLHRIVNQRNRFLAFDVEPKLFQFVG